MPAAKPSGFGNSNPRTDTGNEGIREVPEIHPRSHRFLEAQAKAERVKP
jgi:hypothetical protein